MKGTATAFAFGLAVPAGAQTVPPAPDNRAPQLIDTVPPAPADRVAEMMAVYRDKTAIVRPCPTAPSADIIVCGRRVQRHRLPLPVEPDPEGSHIVRGELPRASAKPVKQVSCGVIQGGRPCNGGLSVFAAAGFLAKLGHKLIDPDWEAEPPPDIPDRFRGAGR